MTSPREVGLLRLVSQGLVGAPTATSPAEAVRQLLAVQAQDLPGALVSVALRTGSRSREQVVAALDDGSVVRSWPMRGTLHLVPAEDLGWLLRTTAARTVARFAGRQAELGLDEATVEHARELAESALASVPDGAGSGDPPAPAGLRRAELMQVWEQAGIATTGQRGYHLVVQLARPGRSAWARWPGSSSCSSRRAGGRCRRGPRRCRTGPRCPGRGARQA